MDNLIISGDFTIKDYSVFLIIEKLKDNSIKLHNKYSFQDITYDDFMNKVHEIADIYKIPKNRIFIDAGGIKNER